MKDLPVNTIINSDCLEALKTLPENSVDSIVTDPPYGLEFMGKEWDKGVPGVHFWQEMLRVLKPGGHLLAFGGTRTYHRMACAIEDAGFEIRDMIEWVYGSGFPKSLSVGKAINSLETNEWSKISKALDNINQKSIMEVWKSSAKLAGIQLSKSLTEVGSNTPKNFFVPDIAVLYHRNKVEVAYSPVFIAELKSIGLTLLSEENGIIAHESVDTSTILLQDRAKFAVKLLPNPEALSMNIFTAECNVKEWLNANTEVNHKVDEALKTLRGNKKYSNEEITNVLCVALTDILKLTILNQSKTFQNLDTKSKMECVSAINVIITEYTAENLISNTVAILKSKAVDKLQGNERKVVGCNGTRPIQTSGRINAEDSAKGKFERENNIVTKGTSEWEGWGTALKPAHEPICMARKPLAEKNVAENILKYGCGGINIDESRVVFDKDNENFGKEVRDYGEKAGGQWQKGKQERSVPPATGRFPANLILSSSDEVKECFPETGKSIASKRGADRNGDIYGKYNECDTIHGHDDNGGSASRFFKSIIYQTEKDIDQKELEILDKEIPPLFFDKWQEIIELYKDGDTYEDLSPIEEFIFNIIQYYKNEPKGKSIIYQAKASKSERNKGCEDLEEKRKKVAVIQTKGVANDGDWEDGKQLSSPQKNNHPTVKPIALMEYLIKMITPKGGVVLDPFMGSGTTGVACNNLDYNFIGIEFDTEYFKIAEKRINNYAAQQEFF